MTFCFSVTLQLPSSYFTHNGILSGKLFHSLQPVSHYPPTLSNRDFVFLHDVMMLSVLCRTKRKFIWVPVFYQRLLCVMALLITGQSQIGT